MDFSRFLLWQPWGLRGHLEGERKTLEMSRARTPSGHHALCVWPQRGHEMCVQEVQHQNFIQIRDDLKGTASRVKHKLPPSIVVYGIVFPVVVGRCT